MTTFLSKLIFIAKESADSSSDEALNSFFKKLGDLINSSNATNTIVDIIIKMAFTILIAFLIIQLYRFFWKKWWKNHQATLLHKFIYNVVLILIYIITGIAVILCIPGSETIVSSIIAGSSFLALGLSLASQEALGNVINGMMITVSKPFEVGDRIHIISGNITGYVEDITLRHTVIKTFVNSRIIVPNSAMNKDMIENSNYQQGKASSFVDVVITYDSDMDAAIEVMISVIESHPSYINPALGEDIEGSVKVFVRDLSINGVALRASIWTQSTDNNFAASSDIRYEIKKQFDARGILLAQLPARPMESNKAGTPVVTESYYVADEE